MIAGDGRFCNRAVMAAIPERVVLIAWTRKDAKLCFPAKPGTRRTYAAEKFTPDQVRQDEKPGWNLQTFPGGKRRGPLY